LIAARSASDPARTSAALGKGRYGSLDGLGDQMAAQTESLVAFAHVADVERSIKFHRCRFAGRLVPASAATTNRVQP